MVAKAYKNMPFLVSREARTLRILSEYLGPRASFRHYDVTDTIIMFGSARAIPGEEAEPVVDPALQIAYGCAHLYVNSNAVGGYSHLGRLGAPEKVI